MENTTSRIKEIGEHLRKRLQQAGVTGLPLGWRLFLFLAVLLLTLFLGVIAILLLTGTFTAGLSENERLLDNELARASSDITAQFGQISLQTVELANNLSRSIEQNAREMDIALSDLSEHPDLLEEIILNEYDKVLFALLVAKSSGVFLILDATVNPALAQAEDSRAGLYIKNMEPNVISASAPNITFLRGFPGISRRKSLPLHAQWQMEFDISEAPYYHRPIEAARSNPHLPVSRLYYWSSALKLPDTSEVIMLCAAPLIDSDGSLFGVCGLEISEMLFKLTNMPANSFYKRIFCLLAPVEEDTIELRRTLFAGGYAARIISGEQNILQISKQRRHFYSYKQNRSKTFLGLHREVQLYPQDSPFSHERWTAAIMLPKDDILSTVTRLNLIIFSSLTLLVILGAVISFSLSNKFFVRPISNGFDAIKSMSPGSSPRTMIPEIDDLVDHLALHNRELAEKARREHLSFDILNEFMKRTGELTPAERKVFKLYGEGLTAQEVAEKQSVSINTIKTHSKHIYMKLEIKSREELILYVALLKEMGTFF